MECSKFSGFFSIHYFAIAVFLIFQKKKNVVNLYISAELTLRKRSNYFEPSNLYIPPKCLKASDWNSVPLKLMRLNEILLVTAAVMALHKLQQLHCVCWNITWSGNQKLFIFWWILLKNLTLFQAQSFIGIIETIWKEKKLGRGGNFKKFWSLQELSGVFFL